MMIYRLLVRAVRLTLSALVLIAGVAFGLLVGPAMAVYWCACFFRAMVGGLASPTPRKPERSGEGPAAGPSPGGALPGIKAATEREVGQFLRQQSNTPDDRQVVSAGLISSWRLGMEAAAQIADRRAEATMRAHPVFGMAEEKMARSIADEIRATMDKLPAGGHVERPQ